MTNIRVTQSDMLSDKVFKKISRNCAPFTMTSLEKMYALYGGIRHLAREKVHGKFVECGVWRGGSLMVMMYTLLQHNLAERDIVVFDLFDNPDQEGNRYWQSISQKEVEKNIKTTSYPSTRIEIHPGDVRTTLPCKIGGPIALLRLDTDLYSTTKHTLEHLFTHVCSGGLVIIDDYGSHPEGAGLATDEFLASQGLAPFLQRIDAGGRMFFKQ